MRHTIVMTVMTVMIIALHFVANCFWCCQFLCLRWRLFVKVAVMVVTVMMVWTVCRCANEIG